MLSCFSHSCNITQHQCSRHLFTGKYQGRLTCPALLNRLVAEPNITLRSSKSLSTGTCRLHFHSFFTSHTLTSACEQAWNGGLAAQHVTSNCNVNNGLLPFLTQFFKCYIGMQNHVDFVRKNCGQEDRSVLPSAQRSVMQNL